MNIFGISIIELWLIIGVVFIIIEFTNIPNIGFLFLGFGALSNAIIIYNYSMSLKYQYVIFGLASFLWFIILWWPLKYYVYKNNKQRQYYDMIGSEVQVYNGKIMPGKTGQVQWSGTIMNAKLGKNEEEAQVGDKLRIIQIEGNVLICMKIKN